MKIFTPIGGVRSAKFTIFCSLALAVCGSANAAIYNNGPLITNPTGGAGGAPISELTTPNTIFGFGGGPGGNRLADDFTVTDAAGWSINSFTCYGYLTGSTTTSTATAVNYRIWSGVPGAGGVILHDFSAANQMTATSWTGIYRVQNTTPTLTNRPIMQMEASGNSLRLAPGTYWIDFNYTGVSFTPPVTPAPAGANGRQFLATTALWAPLLDGAAPASVPQEVPFLINYTVNIPGPGGAALLALGGLVAGGRRRRRA